MSYRKAFVMVMFVLLMGNPEGGTANEIPNKETSGSHESSTVYTLGHGDLISIQVWKEPDFSLDECAVRLDGKITLPLVNDIQAAGRSTRALKAHLEIVLRKYIDNPVVTVMLKEARSQRFYILGEVTRTGEYLLSKELTVLQAFAIAGGFTQWANKKEIFVLRREGGRDAVIKVNYPEIIAGRNFEGNITLQADDTIVVP